MSEERIRFDRVTKAYGETVALQDFSLTVALGEFLTVIGRSGCGKTTAIKMVNGLLRPDSGRVFVDGKDVSESDYIQLRRRIGYVIQNVGLFPHMSVEKNIAYVPTLTGDWDRRTQANRVSELLELVGLAPQLAARYPSELSGGQQQRVGIARALAARPEILLMDEPFGAVDDITRRALQEELQSLQRQLGITVLLVTHDIREAMRLGSRMMVMDMGKIIQIDTPSAIVSSPENNFVRELVQNR